MNVVIQCAASKRVDAGCMRTDVGRPVVFVANPLAAPTSDVLEYARPDDVARDGRTWRELLLEYNKAPGSNPLKLLPSVDLYENPVYRRLATKFGLDKLFILSAGWGLIPASFLTPAYDITFSQSADSYKRRRKNDAYGDLRLLPLESPLTTVFLGGKDYLPLFCRLTHGAKARRIVFFNAKTPPDAPGCNLRRFETTTRTNWHYECAQALIEDRLPLPA
ncbi:MAG: hypothetical protein JNM90_25845 [Burkholderiales bacterium]|nr:hypothetical protein [Burkholderiales bacterium]